jgi:hypothetical protein
LESEQKAVVGKRRTTRPECSSILFI